MQNVLLLWLLGCWQGVEVEIFYEGDQNTLYYKIYKRLGTYMMFLWTTNGFSNYKEYNNLEELKDSFLELTSKQLDL